MKFFEAIEGKLMEREKYGLVKRLHRFENCFVSGKKQNQWIRRHINEKWKGAALVDREVYITEEITALEKLGHVESLSVGDTEKLTKFKDELQGMDGEWWFHERAKNKILQTKPKGPKIRAQDWYFKLSTSEERQGHCKARGGCCGHDCNCCSKPRLRSRKTASNHCSAYCGCCIRRRGFEKIPKRPDTYPYQS